MKQRLIFTIIALAAASLLILAVIYALVFKYPAAGPAPKTDTAIDQEKQLSLGSGVASGSAIPASEFETVSAGLDTAEKISAYLKNNFSITDAESDSALAPADFFAKKSGGPQDAAVFACEILKLHNFESLVLRYKGNLNGQPFTHTVAVFRDTDVPKYLTAGSDGIKIIAHGWSFEDLLKKEEARTGAMITGYAVFAPGTVNLVPAEWEKRK